MSIKANIEKINKTVKQYNAHLIAVSKTKPADQIMEAYEAGIVDFGENKVQELVEKEQQLPKDIRWHMIGHLQRNKVKYIAPFVYLIHGVDSLRLLKEIDKQGKRLDRVISCLLQVHIAEEESKFGFSIEELNLLFEDPDFTSMRNIVIKGFMGMATFTEDPDQIKKEFMGLQELFKSFSSLHSDKSNVDMKILSMGMSGDFEIALESGSNMVRVGSSIFGSRNY